MTRFDREEAVVKVEFAHCRGVGPGRPFAVNAYLAGHSMDKRAARPWMRQCLAAGGHHRRTVRGRGRHRGVIDDPVDDHLGNVLIDWSGIRRQFRNHPGQLAFARNVPVDAYLLSAHPVPPHSNGQGSGKISCSRPEGNSSTRK